MTVAAVVASLPSCSAKIQGYRDWVAENEILEERINGSKKYSIESTPTIFINEKKYEGKHDYEDFKKEIEKCLNTKKQG